MLNVLVESNATASLLSKLLRAEQAADLVGITASSPSSSLYGRTRTLLGVRGEPVAVVLDAESTDEDAVERRRQSAEEVIGEAARAAPLRVMIAVPSVEALLFKRPDAVRRVFSQASDSLIELGLASPKDALKRIDPHGSAPAASHQIVLALNGEDVSSLRAEPPVKDLLEFLAELQKNGMVSTAVGA